MWCQEAAKTTGLLRVCPFRAHQLEVPEWMTQDIPAWSQRVGLLIVCRLFRMFWWNLFQFCPCMAGRCLKGLKSNMQASYPLLVSTAPETHMRQLRLSANTQGVLLALALPVVFASLLQALGVEAGAWQRGTVHLRFFAKAIFSLLTWWARKVCLSLFLEKNM